MKRDLDFHQDFNAKLADENRSLKADVEGLRNHLELRDKELTILNKQVNGLKEDNERIAKMYQFVHNVKEGKPATSTEEMSASSKAWEQIRVKDKAD